MSDSLTLREQLKNAICAERLPHALFFLGESVCCDELIGLSCAELFGTSVEKLSVCPDYYTYLGSTMNVASAEEIIDNLTRIPSGRCRVIHVKNAGLMPEDVQNKLLKTLEEPPHGNYFILQDQQGGLLPTVQSRCMCVNVGELTPKQAALYVIRATKECGLEIDEPDAIYYCSLADSNISTAIRLATDSEYLKMYYECLEFTCKMGKQSLMCSQMDDFAKTADEAKCLVDVMCLCDNDMLRLKIGMLPHTFIRNPYAEKLRMCASGLTKTQLIQVYEYLLRALGRFAGKYPIKQTLYDLVTNIEQVVS